MALEKAKKEEMKREFEAKIEEKERLFEELKDSMKSKSPEKSLKDELEEMLNKTESEMVTGIVSMMVNDKTGRPDTMEPPKDDLKRANKNLTSSLPLPELASAK